MEPVMLVEVVDDHGHVQQRQRVTGAGSQCRIGRSLACDLTLDDGFVAPEHTLLTLQQDGRVLVQDQGTRNGTQFDGVRIDAASGRLIAGGELLVGRSHVRVRTAEAQLAPEKLFRRDIRRRHRVSLAAAGVFLWVGFAAFTAWAQAPPQAAQDMVVAVLLAFAALAIWTGAWALVSRLTVGGWQLAIHLALAGICLALWGWGYWLYTLAAFAFQWRSLGPFTVALAGVVAFVVAWRHLRYATHLPRAAALSLAVLAPLLCGGVWWLVDLQVDQRTVNRVVQGARIHPPAVRVAPSMDLGDYLTDVAELKREANRNRQQSLLESPVLDEKD
ncbi:MAG TPA: FHA domain-containing protein [Steroidobacteraceae bacterium]|nr:FHA domain-containing protein [Steroidobacteraceae bacterium]